MEAAIGKYGLPSFEHPYVLRSFASNFEKRHIHGCQASIGDGQVYVKDLSAAALAYCLHCQHLWNTRTGILTAKLRVVCPNCAARLSDTLLLHDRQRCWGSASRKRRKVTT